MKKLLIAGAVVAGILVLGVMGLVAYGLVVLSRSPETHVQSHGQIPKRYADGIRQMGLLEPGERLVHFYSDAMVDYQDGFYAATDRKLILYSKEWDPKAVLLPYGEIESIEAEYSTSILLDSDVTVTATDGREVDFPLSSERKGDRRFVEYVRSRLAPPTPSPADGGNPPDPLK